MVIKNPDFDGSGSAKNVKTSSFFPQNLEQIGIHKGGVFVLSLKCKLDCAPSMREGILIR